MAAQIISTRAQLISAPAAHTLGAGASGHSYKKEAENQQLRDDRLHNFAMEENEQKALLDMERAAAGELARSRLAGGSTSMPYSAMTRALYGGSGATPPPVFGKTEPFKAPPIDDPLAEERKRVFGVGSDGKPLAADAASLLEQQYDKALADARAAINGRLHGVEAPGATAPVPRSSLDRATQNVFAQPVVQQAPTVPHYPSPWGNDWDYDGATRPAINAYATVGNVVDDLINFRNEIA